MLLLLLLLLLQFCDIDDTCDKGGERRTVRNLWNANCGAIIARRILSRGKIACILPQMEREFPLYAYRFRSTEPPLPNSAGSHVVSRC